MVAQVDIIAQVIKIKLKLFYFKLNILYLADYLYFKLVKNIILIEVCVYNVFPFIGNFFGL